MASIQSQAFNVFLRLISKKSFLKKQFEFGKFDFYDCPEPPEDIRDICTVEKRTVSGHNVFTLRPKHGTSGKHILYLHGGAYVQNFVKQHWTFLADLVKTLQCTITAPAYPLAPKYTYRNAFEMVIPLYKNLSEDIAVREPILMGDSAGGGFALALAQHLHTVNLPQPAKIVLLSPWLDLTLQNTAIHDIDPMDPFLGVEGLRKAGKCYAGNTNPEMYMLSPINGPFKNLAPIYIFIGSRDLLVADARKLKTLMAENKVTLHYHEYEDMIHVWMLLNFPESRKARREIIKIIGRAE